ncbi:uncharacterized protein V6R79_001949 [Siganus canaliculatus]
MTSRDYRSLQRIWHRASGDYFDVMSERFDRHADTSKNIRDVSKPETALAPAAAVSVALTRDDAWRARDSWINMPAESVTHLLRKLCGGSGRRRVRGMKTKTSEVMFRKSLINRILKTGLISN